jgi:hypothetical protein
MSSIKTLSFLFMLSACFLFWIWVSVSSSRAFRLEKLPDRGKNWNCATCHVNPAGGGAQNAFGKDYRGKNWNCATCHVNPAGGGAQNAFGKHYREIALPAGDRYTKELGQKDSDGDGFTNDEEFNANPPTKPWDAESHPPPRAVEPRFKKFTVWGKLKKR